MKCTFSGCRDLPALYSNRCATHRDSVDAPELRGHHINQGAIFVLSSLAMWLIALPALAWWGFALGLVAQPLWLRATLKARQWGMFLNSIAYAGALVVGLITHWS